MSSSLLKLVVTTPLIIFSLSVIASPNTATLAKEVAQKIQPHIEKFYLNDESLGVFKFTYSVSQADIKKLASNTATVQSNCMANYAAENNSETQLRKLSTDLNDSGLLGSIYGDSKSTKDEGKLDSLKIIYMAQMSCANLAQFAMKREIESIRYKYGIPRY